MGPSSLASLKGLLEAQRAFLEDCLEVGDLASASRLLGVRAEALEAAALRLREARLKRRLAEVACTKEAREVLREALEVLVPYAHTSMAKRALKLRAPSLDRGEVEAWRRRVEEARLVIKAGRLIEVGEVLKAAEPRPRPLPKLSVSLALTSRRLFEEAFAKYGAFVDVELIDSAERARATIEGHDVTLALTELPVEEPGVVSIAGLEDVEVVPHLLIELYASWAPVLKAALKLLELGVVSGVEELAVKEAEAIVEELEHAYSLAIPSKPPVEEAVDWVEAELLKGRLAPPRALEALVEEASKRFNLSSKEAEALREAVSLARAPPIPRLRLRELRAEFRRRAAEEVFNYLRRAARKLLQSRRALVSLVKSLVDLDAALAIARFMERYGCTWASLTDGLSLGFVDAKNLALLQEELRGGPKVQPVSYTVGPSSIKLLGATPQRVVLLTGANSGGKTTLLKTMAQVHLMTLAGLPVPARRAEVPLARLYFIRRRTAKKLGSLEYAIKRLRLIFSRPGPKIVLIDEFEALTEPGAMGRMMAALLNNMPRRALTVFVTHLAYEIMPRLAVQYRVDGIEARGVDERGGLVVDRQPIFNHVGSSSPELVVEKLVSTAPSRRLRAVYEEMLKALRAAGP
ncbi:MAG: hypothetical protein N3H31_07310 [Candidatus Nezhaarchaeota archaeon]|nr:hypothetical protein [Candidatus Nezhaarchaeota archaeon]